MAKPESKRVESHRKKYFDRISCLIEKGGLSLINTLALHEGIKKAEVIRRAVLARAGLRMMPFPDALKELDDVKTQKEATAAILRLQAHEESSEIINQLLEELSPEPDSAKYEAECSYDLQRIAQKLTAAEKGSKVILSGYEVGILRRFLANIQDVV